MAPDISMDIPVNTTQTSTRSNLAQTIEQIVRQKGPFHKITYQTIKNDAANPVPMAVDQHDMDVDDDNDSPTLTSEQRVERLTQKGVEYMQELQRRGNDIHQLLDSMSMLLSSSSAAAASSISPGLLAQAPAGAMVTRSIKEKETSPATLQKALEVSVSRRIQKFSHAASMLSDAAARFDKESASQEKYWSRMSSLQSSKFPVSRLPNSDGVVVIHYGSAESAPRYQRQGVAAVRQNEMGEVMLLGQNTSRKRKFLSVSVTRNGETTGESSHENSPPHQGEPLERAVTEARDTLFSDELWDEASKEARLLTNLRVTARSDAISFDISEDCKIEVSYTASANADASGINNKSDDHHLADFVLNSLDLMLVAEHERRYHQRSSRPPLPLSSVPSPTPAAAILRPIITRLRHDSQVEQLRAFLSGVLAYLRHADLNCDQTVESDRTPDTPFPALDRLRRACRTRIEISLPSSSIMTITIETFLGPPQFGTHYTATAPSYSIVHDDQPRSLPPTSSVGGLETFILDALCEDIAHLFATTAPPYVRWETMQVSPAEVLLVHKEIDLAKVEIHCEKDRLKVRSNGKTTKAENFIWDKRNSWRERKSGGADQIEKGLMDVINVLVHETVPKEVKEE